MLIKKLIKRLIRFIAITKLSKYILNALPNNQVNVLISPRTKPNKVFNFFFAMIARYNKLEYPVYRNTKFVFVNEFNMNLDVSEFTQCLYFLNSLDLEFISEIRFGGSVFLDIGANVGIFSLIASQTFDEVVAFEPSPKTYEILKSNIELNSYKNITLHNIGLSNQKTTMKLYLNPLNNGGATLNKNVLKGTTELKKESWDSIDVKVDILDKISELQNKKIDFIKIDVEGYELSVLEGAVNLIKTNMPLIYAEISKDYEKVLDILAILPDSYRALSLIDRKYIDDNSITNIPNDVLFVPKSYK